MTTNLTTPQAEAARAATADAIDLWCGMKIEYIRGSGEVGSGKTMFGLNIDPNTRRFDVPATTLVWDFEGSASPYEGLNFERRDLTEIVRKYTGGRAYKPIDLYLAWYQDMLTVPHGRYWVGMVDTFQDVETGLIEWVKANPQQFGRTRDQYVKAASMFLWPDVKAYAKQLIFSELRSRFQTFYTTHHLKNQWEGNKKTGQRVTEGMDVLEKLASLHLKFDRTAAKGKVAPDRPAAILGKARLIKFGATPEEDRPILPPRLPIATPQAIREYIKKPADYHNLKKDEQLPDGSLSDDQKLLIQQDIALANMQAAQATLEQANLMHGMGVGMTISASPIPDTITAEEVATPEEPAAIASPLATPDQIEALKTIIKSHYTRETVSQFMQIYVAPSGAAKITELTADQAQVIIDMFRAGHANGELAGQQLTPPQAEPTPAADPRFAKLEQWAKESAASLDMDLLENGGKATKWQLTRIRQLFERVWPDRNDQRNRIMACCTNHGGRPFTAFTVPEANDLIHQLLEVELGFKPDLSNEQVSAAA